MFLDELEKISKVVKSVINEKKIKIISQFDADGISSAAILIKTMLRENVNFEATIVKQLTLDVVKSLDIKKDDFLIISDCGSGQLNILEDIFDETQVLILDHHEPVNKTHPNLLHLNPLIFSEGEISASMVCYLFAKSLNPINADLIDLAITGAIGDMQEENWGMSTIAKKILNEAETMGKVSVMKGLRLYGNYSRPLSKSLAISYDPFIPGISGSESNAIQLLSELGISVKENGEWKKMKDLTPEEQQKLASAIIKERMGGENPADIFGENYTALGRPEELQDLKEFATLLNACGRTGNAETAIRLCLGDNSAIHRAWDVLYNYRKLIADSLNWLRDNKDAMFSTNSCNYILGNSRIPDTIIGTVTSIALNSNFFSDAKPIFGFADLSGEMVKVSARMPRNLDLNLRGILVNAIKETGLEAGGHSKAAGAVIPKGKEHEFIKIIDRLMGELVGSEKS